MHRRTGCTQTLLIIITTTSSTSSSTHRVDARAHVGSIRVERRLHQAKLLGGDEQLAGLAKLLNGGQKGCAHFVFGVWRGVG